VNDADRQILKIFFKNNNNMGLLFLKQVKTGMAYAESSFLAGLRLLTPGF